MEPVGRGTLTWLACLFYRGKNSIWKWLIFRELSRKKNWGGGASTEEGQTDEHRSQKTNPRLALASHTENTMPFSWPVFSYASKSNVVQLEVWSHLWFWNWTQERSVFQSTWEQYPFDHSGNDNDSGQDFWAARGCEQRPSGVMCMSSSSLLSLLSLLWEPPLTQDRPPLTPDPPPRTNTDMNRSRDGSMRAAFTQC